MKTLLFIISMFFLVNVGYSQKTNQKPKVNAKQNVLPLKKKVYKPIKNYNLPTSYYVFVKHEDGTIDTVMLFRDPIVRRN
jgi:hypothetical protein